MSVELSGWKHPLPAMCPIARLVVLSQSVLSIKQTVGRAVRTGPSQLPSGVLDCHNIPPPARSGCVPEIAPCHRQSSADLVSARPATPSGAQPAPGLRDRPWTGDTCPTVLTPEQLHSLLLFALSGRREPVFGWL